MAMTTTRSPMTTTRPPMPPTAAPTTMPPTTTAPPRVDFLANKAVGAGGQPPGAILSYGTTARPTMTADAPTTTHPWWDTTTIAWWTTPPPPPPCNFTRDSMGVMKPLRCQPSLNYFPIAVCVDVPGWVDSENKSCSEYVRSSWCGGSSSYTAGGVANYANAGYNGDTACCACGGGTYPPEVQRSGVENVTTCHMVESGLFRDLTDCLPPPGLPTCPGNLGMNQQFYKERGYFADYGATRNVTCAEGSAPIQADVTLTTWGEAWYPGRTIAYTRCIDGHWTNMTWLDWGATRPSSLICLPIDTIKLLREMHHQLKWSEHKLAETEAGGYRWIDAGAQLRKATLTTAMDNARKYFHDSVEGKARVDNGVLQLVIDTLVEYRLVPGGKPHSYDTCNDFAKHALWQLTKNSDSPPLGFPNYIPAINETSQTPTASDVPLSQSVGFSCSFAEQKVGAGFDPFTRTVQFIYRDGCFCDSKFTTLCPFNLDNTPTYKVFGFDALDEKPVTTRPGAPSNALCWYWSKPDHPEWGYLYTPVGNSYQAPMKNSTDLVRAWNAKRQAIQAR